MQNVNIFTITIIWKHPKQDLPKDTSRIQRSDPLQFPNMMPPTGRTHFHGRWVLTQQNKRPVWIDYPPCNVNQFFDLPPNLPMIDAHWRGRKLPGAVQPFFSFQDVVELIARHRHKEGIMFDNHHAHKPKASEHEVKGSSNRAQVVRFRSYPSDYLERTPLRYLPSFKQPRFPEEQQLVTPPGGRIQPFQSTSS